MKKQLTILLCLCLIAALLCACGSKTAENTEKNDPTPAAPAAPAEKTEAPSTDPTPAKLPNPITEYASLDEINEAVGGHLCHPPVMGVMDETFSVIQSSESSIAQYCFSVGGTRYTYRFSPDTAEDISGIYADNGLLFSGDLGETEAFRSFKDGFGARFCNEDGQYVLTGQRDGGIEEDAFRAVSRELFSLAGPQLPNFDAFLGSWHDNIAGRGNMTVTQSDDHLVFDVRWSDSASTYYVWTFTGTPDANGVLTYDGGFYGKAEFSDDGKETKTILDEDASGTIEIAADGTMLWTENNETHEFVKEPGLPQDAALNAFLGSWHDAIAGRGMMDVIFADGQLVFDVRWSDSASAYYAWTFAGTPDANGVLAYDGGFYGKVELDANEKETKTILDEDASGTVEIAADGTMLWTESNETHEFVKDA